MSVHLSEYLSFFYDVDPNLRGLPLINSSFNIVQIILLYLFVVLRWGPNYMKNRPAYNLKTIILLYNASQIYANCYLLYIGVPNLLTKNYFELKADAIEIKLCYYYFLLKIYDLIETVMFVMRKKQNQVSFLHVYHHVMILVFTFFGVRFAPGGHNIIYGLINVIVHAIMYVYYFLAAYDSTMPWLRKWKKYMTQIQLIQFVLLGIHYSWPIYYGHCCISKSLCFASIFQAIVMIVLFGNFYIKTYVKKAKFNQ